jgi:hypothetical protein
LTVQIFLIQNTPHSKAQYQLQLTAGLTNRHEALATYAWAHAVITIDFNYEEGAKGAFTPVVREYTVDGLRSGKSKHALDVQGLTNAPIVNLRLTNCTFDNVADGSVVKNIKDASLENVKINGKSVEALAT